MSLSFARAVLVAGLLLLPAVVSAKTFSVPDPNPIAVVTLPNDWDTLEIDGGLESTSKDQAVYIAVEVTELKDASKTIAETVAWMKKKKIVVDEKSMEQSAVVINGLDGYGVKWNANDEDGPTRVALTLLQVTDTKGLVLTFWASPAAQEKYGKDLASIRDSLRALK
ncbi:MAG: hypothetical protein EOP23_12470 [Hyphomicrobiales bacterium]|nr:MAG: hypothetical protein EOP23_12470 [Hyphomicrobiales bacterium]